MDVRAFGHPDASNALSHSFRHVSILELHSDTFDLHMLRDRAGVVFGTRLATIHIAWRQAPRDAPITRKRVRAATSSTATTRHQAFKANFGSVLVMLSCVAVCNALSHDAKYGMCFLCLLQSVSMASPTQASFQQTFQSTAMNQLWGSTMSVGPQVVSSFRGRRKDAVDSSAIISTIVMRTYYGRNVRNEDELEGFIENYSTE